MTSSDSAHEAPAPRALSYLDSPSATETVRAALALMDRRMHIRPATLTLLVVLAACGAGLFVLPPGVPTKILGAVLIVVAFAVLVVSELAGRSDR